MRARRADPPYQRTGLCCGEACMKKPKLDDVPLYRVGMLWRYRCRECFRAEVGNFP